MNDRKRAAAAILSFFALPALGASPARPADLRSVICESREGERQHCPADTSAGVVLVRVIGTAGCLLGRSWGYDDDGIWVADGCGGEFKVKEGPAPAEPAPPPVAEKSPEYIPMRGFRL
jgi:hypothetical protein